MPNVIRIEGACCHAVIHFSTCLCHLWEPFSLLLFIASEFCFVSLCNEVFVKWSVVWSKVPLQFHMSGYRFSNSSLTVFKNMFILYCVSLCDVILWCWLKNIWSCVFYDLAAMSTACINSMIQTVAWNEASCVVTPVLLRKHNQCCNDIQTCSSPEVCSLI